MSPLLELIKISTRGDDAVVFSRTATISPLAVGDVIENLIAETEFGNGVTPDKPSKAFDHLNI
jgi:hypothetical protein